MVQSAMQVGIHMFLWVAALAVMMFLVPRFQDSLADLKFKVPWVTEIILDISGWFMDFWFFSAPLIIILLLAFDGPIYFFLRLRFPRMSWLWSGAMVLLPLAVLLMIFFSSLLPLVKVLEGTS